jgi:hypothetical protein
MQTFMTLAVLALATGLATAPSEAAARSFGIPSAAMSPQIKAVDMGGIIFRE